MPMRVTAITHRKKAIVTSYLSQVAPSESSVIKRVAYEPLFLEHLRTQVGLKGVRRVVLHEALTNLRKWIIVQVARDMPTTEVWRALYATANMLRAWGKYVVAVNEDIDPDNADALLWALAYRCNPALDLQILHHRDQGHGPRSARNGGVDAAVLYDATLKEDYPPVSLPKREYMERARQIWEELGLPALKPEAPWYGYSLGEWSEEFERAAALAVKGESFETGKIIAQRRRKDVPMNTEVRRLPKEEE
jgi:4-hydroxy-3-polyprenylbenzoate decarboxylase